MASLQDLAATADVVAAASSRNEKVAALAGFLVSLVDSSHSLREELAPAIGFLIGEPRQGRIGVGWATVAKTVAQPADIPSLRISDLDQLLTTLQSTTGPGSVTRRTELLQAALSAATESETRFIRRLLQGDLRQGALAGVMTTAVAKAAKVPVATVRRGAMLLGDLPDAGVIALTSGVDGLAQIGLQVGRPVQPMLASTSSGVAEALADIGGSVSVEWKLDGIRVQVHKDHDKINVYTRNLNEVTGRLRHLSQIVQGFDCDSCVLDGEMIGFGPDDMPEAFQDTMSQLGTESEPVAANVRPFFFDLLLVDGVSLIDRPQSERRQRLIEAVGDYAIPAVTTSDATAAENQLQLALSAGHEGVVVKAVDGYYEAGRRGKSWRKVKPVHTVDLVVLAAEWGHGRRQGWLSNLHLGALDPETREPVMVGKTFKGLTDELLEWQTKEFLAREVEREGITVFIKHDLVVEIAVDGAQRSTRYPGGVALRFARVKAYRPDKTPAEADNLDTLRKLLP